MSVQNEPTGFHLGLITSGPISGTLLGVPEEKGSFSIGLYFSRFAKSKDGWVRAGRLWPQHVPHVREIIQSALSMPPEKLHDLYEQRGAPNWFLTPSPLRIGEAASWIERGAVLIAIEPRERPLFGRRFSWRPLRKGAGESVLTWFSFSHLPDLLEALQDADDLMQRVPVEETRKT